MERDSASPEGTSTGARRGDGAFPWVLLVIAALVGAVLAAFRPDRTTDVPLNPQRGADGAVLAWSPAPRPEGETVSVTIDFGNGARRYWDALPWEPNVTLGAVMQRARIFRPPLEFTQRGEGAQAFLTSLEGVENEGGDGRNWMYAINGDEGQESFAAAELAPGDAVLWEFRSAE